MPDSLRHRLQELVDCAISDTSERSRRDATRTMVSLIEDSDLTDKRIRQICYEHLHYLLSKCREADDAWEWLKQTASSMIDDSERIEISIAIWAPWPNEPVSWLPLSRLYRLWFAPATKWCVYFAYEDAPDLLPKHFEEYAKTDEYLGPPNPSISDADFIE